MSLFAGLAFAVFFGYIVVSVWVYFARVMPALDAASIAQSGRSTPYALRHQELLRHFRTFKAILQERPRRPWYYWLVCLQTRPWLHFGAGILLFVLWAFLTWLGPRAV